MGTFALDTSDDVLLKQADNYLSWKNQYDEAAEDRADPYIISQYHREWLIRKIVLTIEQEIIRHSIWEKMGHYHWFFNSLKKQRAYIEKMQKAYPIYRKKVKKIIGKKFTEIYKEEKKENNDKVMKVLKESNWTDTYGLKSYLPFFYADGRFKELTEEQYYHNNNNL